MTIHTIDPGKKRHPINFSDHIIYSRVKDLEGKDLDLDLSLMRQSGNIEMQTAGGISEVSTQKFPTIVWFSGGGFRGVDKNQMLLETAYLAEAGYQVASVYYRSSSQGHFPDQIIDCKTAIRFLRANADKYHVDPERIAVMGRSAGGYLAAYVATNTADHTGKEYLEYSSAVQACYDMFGPTDFKFLLNVEVERMKNPGYRWHRLIDTHCGAFIGGDEQTLYQRGVKADIAPFVSDAMAPILIAHGDADPLVPYSVSVDLAKKIADTCGEDRVTLYLVKHAGHGSDEFFQEEMRKLVLSFFATHLH